ncbi:MAG TPA: mannose-1-phosphate guanylyltransferase [Terriglobia bacterium]|nr:mannose-1-phosphate guanylyltransferase [Terriglobia bacterium]
MATPPEKSSRTSSRAVFEHVFALILAGGSGTRFWPLSRRARPKQLLRIFGNESLLKQAAERIRGLVPPARTFVFTSECVQEAVREELPEIPAEQIVAEPASRNTAPAIGLAAYEMMRRDAEGVMLVLPSDHMITRQRAFRQALAAGCQLAARPGRSVVIGIEPTRPETGYGYIRLGAQQNRVGGVSAFRVLGFTEKPSAALARRYLRSGKYLWNGGMFIWRASTLVAHFERYQSAMAGSIRRLSDEGGIRSPETLRRLYPRLESISIDYALMEKIPDVYAVTSDLGWSDVGSWLAAYEMGRKDRHGNVLSASGIVLDSRENMIVSPKKPVAALGVTDLVIVETDDALLVCSKEKSQEVGRIVRELERQKRADLI